MTYQREYDRRLRIGLVGLGGHAYRNVLPALHYLPVELVAVCDTNEALLAPTAREYGVSACFTDSGRMLAEADLEAVLLCVGPRQHPVLARQALEAGRHVWMEKPPAMRADDLRPLLHARGDRVCAVGFKKAFMPAARKAQELLALAEFGALRSLLAVYPMSIPVDGAGVLARGELCNWLANGCHPLSLMLLLGGRVRSVTAVLGTAAEAVGSVNLRFASGSVGVLHLAAGAPAGCPLERYQLFGEGRVIEIDGSARVVFHRGIPFDYGRQREFFGTGTDSGAVVWEATHMLSTLENKSLFVQGIVDELACFCAAVLEGRPLPAGDLEFALHVMEVYEAALMSGGREVGLPE